MSDKLKVALIGAGGMANGVHYPSLVEFQDVEIAGLCDVVEDKLHATADKFSIENRFTDYRKMIEDTSPQAIYVLMPPHHLFDIAIHCLSQKLHTFIEKPPGIYHEQTRQMANCAEAGGVIAMTGFNRRYIPLMRLCRDRCRDKGGVITQAMSSFYKWHTAGPYYSGATDVLYCDAIHAVDTLRWIGGDVKKVAAHVRNQGLSFDTSFNALVEFESGASGVLLTNWRVGGRIHQFEMHAEGVSCYVNPDFKADILVEGGPMETFDPKEVAGSDLFHKYYGFFGENRAFIDACLTGQEPESSMADSVKTMELVDRIYHSPL